MSKIPLYPLAFIVVSTGCATLQLTPRGATVQIGTINPAALGSGYRDVAVLTCSRGYNARSTSSNIVQCQNELRNKAADAGGEVVMITSQHLAAAARANCV